MFELIFFMVALFFAGFAIFHAVNWLHEMFYGEPTEACPECGDEDIRIIGSGQGTKSKMCADCHYVWGRSSPADK